LRKHGITHRVSLLGKFQVHEVPRKTEGITQLTFCIEDSHKAPMMGILFEASAFVDSAVKGT
jgi:hypothetical protein